MKNIIAMLLIIVLFLSANCQTLSVLGCETLNSLSLTASNIGNRGSNIGDIDKNGVSDIVVRGYDYSNSKGVVYLLLLNKNKSIKKATRITPGEGALINLPTSSQQGFGTVANIGDIDNNGIEEIIIGSSTLNICYILYFNNEGDMKSYKTLSSSDLPLLAGDNFGVAVEGLGDLNGDSIPDVAISSDKDDVGGNTGSIYIVFLTKLGGVKTYQKINKSTGNFHGLILGGSFGLALSCIGDLNKDGVIDLAASSTEGVSPNKRGVLWILFLNSDGRVKSHQKISSDSGKYNTAIKTYEYFAASIQNMGDIDGDGNIDIAVSSIADSVNNIQTGRIRVLSLTETGEVKSIFTVDNNNLTCQTANEELFGISLLGGFDIDGDYKNDLVVGSDNSNRFGNERGAVYIISLDGAIHPVQPHSRFTAKDTTGLTTKTFTFTNTSSGYPKQVKWSFTPNTVTYQNGTSETSLDSVQVKFTNAGTYSVQLWVQNPFGQDSLLKTNHIVVSPVGGFEELRNNPFTVYPVPATNELKVDGGEDLNGAVTLSIQNCIGETLSTETRLFTSNTPQVLNTSELPQGLYFLSISHNNIQYSLKFIK